MAKISAGNFYKINMNWPKNQKSFGYFSLKSSEVEHRNFYPENSMKRMQKMIDLLKRQKAVVENSDLC